MTADPISPLAPSFEASLAPRAGDLLSLPFDQYGRMRIAQNVLNALYEGIMGISNFESRISNVEEEPSADSDQAAEQTSDNPKSKIQNPKLRVLDVGGYPGVLRHFLTPAELYDLTVLDVAPDDGSIPGYMQGSGMDLPFGDGSFDVVTALDTLEHIPNPERERFLTELRRVARHAVLLINPVQSVEADVAEETLDEYIRWILDAQQEQLREHRDYGLPDFAATVQSFESGGWSTLAFPVANVYNWLMMMIAKHYLLSLRDDKASHFERTLDRFYNLTFSDADRTEPAYRGVIVAAHPDLQSTLQQIRATYPPMQPSLTGNTERLQLTQVLMTLLDLKTANHEDRLLREQMEARDQHIAQLEQRIATMDIQMDVQSSSANAEIQRANAEIQRLTEIVPRLESEISSKNEHILYLEKLLQGIESGRVLRFTRRISRLLKRG